MVIVGSNRPRLSATMLAAQSLGAIPVNLYQDAARSLVWGDTGAAQYAQSISGDVNNLSITIYGTIDNTPANLADAPGVYSDPAITLTLGW